MVKEINALDKCNKIWDKVKEKLNIKFYSMPVYDQTYIEAKVREFDGKIKINFLKMKCQKKYEVYLHCLQNY